ncbi:hypothetical protein B5Z22_00235 [Bacillus velezensis]|nr:hypothetical protein B5Z20_05720 [Bacillus velezensis]OQV55853.1 hypothetical protein B5Z22_00235 [Bacillus velezensis]OQV62407.1 hypothetical protein B5Z24_00235 [Bacillus velezensis]OQV63333.1 hypothetical protein B5Z23_00235 [Bacillus velezensis]
MVVLHVYSGLVLFMKQVRRKDLFLFYAGRTLQLTNNCEKQTKEPVLLQTGLSMKSNISGLTSFRHTSAVH